MKNRGKSGNKDVGYCVHTAPLRNSPEIFNCTHKALEIRYPTKRTKSHRGFLPREMQARKVKVSRES